MKTIVIDYLRRWRLVFIGVGVMQLFCHLVISQTTAMALFSVIYCGSLLLSFDLARGTPRVCLGLPVTREELAWSWRIVAIVAPAVLFVAGLVVGNLAKAIFQFGEVISLSQATFSISFAVLWLGVAFHLLAHFPGAVAAQDPAKKIKNTIIGGSWGLMVGGGFVLMTKMPNSWDELQPIHWILMAAASISTVFGWLEAEEMVVRRAGPGRAGEDMARLSARGKKTENNWGKSDGLGFLYRVLTLNTVRAIGIFMLVYTAIQVVIKKGNQENWLEAGARVVQEPMTLYIMVPLVLITGLGWLGAIRHFRTLPMRAGRVTLLVCSFFGLPTILLLGAMTFLEFSVGREALTLEWFSRISLMTAPMLLAPGLLLHFGLTWKSYFAVVMPMFAMTPLMIMVLPYLAMPVRGVLCVALWGLGAFLIHRSISRRSETYRHTLTWPMKTA